jgi:hypothetical protein
MWFEALSVKWSVAVMLVASVALAHDADVVFVWPQAQDAFLTEAMTLTAATVLRLAPIDTDGDFALSQQELDEGRPALEAGVWSQAPILAQGRRCQLESSHALLRAGYVELGAQFSCAAGERRQDFRFLSVLPPNYRVVLGRTGQSETSRPAAQGPFSVLTLPAESEPVANSQQFLSGMQWGAVSAMRLQWVGLVTLASCWRRRRTWALALAIMVAAVFGASFVLGSDELALRLGRAAGATAGLSAVALLAVPLMSLVLRRWRTAWLVPLAVSLVGALR